MRVTTLCGVLLLALSPAVVAADEQAETLARGRYLFWAGACDSCHTDHEHHGAFLAGGRALETNFGTFHMPNITPAPETGIGGWEFEDFYDAMHRGIRPDGSHYYPSFPYRWYTGLTDDDLRDLWAYLQTVPPVENRVPPHDLRFPYKYRFLILGWKLVNFDQGETVHDPEKSAAWNRGAYLVNHLGHCGACHTPKIMGALFKTYDFLAGSEQIPGPYPAPNITPDETTGIGDWSIEDIARALKRAITPDGVPIRGPMAEYVAYGSGHLSTDDLEAAAVYLKTIEPEDGPVAEREERTDRRLEAPEGVQSETGGGAGGIGSEGMALLRLEAAGRTRAK